MKIIDLSHVLENGMPYYPGTAAPVFDVPSTIAVNGYKETGLSISTHHGTHIDCPAHFIELGATTDSLPVETFYGRGLVVDCTHYREYETIGLEAFEPFKDVLPKIDFVLLHTGWDKLWGTKDYFKHFPVIGADVAKYFVEQTNIKGIGTDVISIDRIDSFKFEVHKILLGHNKIIVENLTNLDQLLGKDFTFACFPLKIKAGDGSPVRAVGILD